MNDNVENSVSKQVDSEDFSCPQCGAPVHYNPETSTLVCEYCAFQQVLNGIDSDEEYNFETAESNENTSWQKETRLVKCENCGAENIVSSTEISSTCPFCGSNQVIETHELVGIKPHRVIPFSVPKDQAESTYIGWLKKKFFTPTKIKKQKVKLNINGVYLPMWTFDANSFSKYVGKLGKYYTVTVGSGKNRHTETRIRWFNISGTTQVKFDDILVNAGKQISQSEINQLSPFQTNDSYLYEQKFLVGFSAEHYQVKLQLGWNNAKNLAKPAIERSILKKYHYDVVGNLDIKTNYTNVKYKYVLIPVWIGTYDYEKKKYRFIVNGETGKLVGKAPLSPLKITFTVLGIVIFAILLFLLVYFSGSM